MLVNEVYPTFSLGSSEGFANGGLLIMLSKST